jgi:hypothetical protein
MGQTSEERIASGLKTKKDLNLSKARWAINIKQWYLKTGLVIGSIIALTTVGLTLTHGILRLSNFAYADFYDIGSLVDLGSQNWRA